jgi:hypothetical protein
VTKKLAFILVICPFTALYLPNLLMLLDSEFDEVVVLQFYSRNLLDQHQDNDIYGKAKYISFIHAGNMFKYYECTARAINFIKRASMSGRTVSYFIPHPNHILTNFIYFSVGLSHVGGSVNIANLGNGSIVLIPDGLANYYSPKLRPYMFTMIGKFLLCCTLGFVYRIYRGNYIYPSEMKYSFGILFSKESVTDSLPNFSLLKINSISSSESGACPSRVNTVLLLGGFVANLPCDFLEYFDIITRFFSTVSDGNLRLFYKPHPNEPPALSSLLMQRLPAVEFIDKAQKIELTSSKYARIYSFYSSALLNIRIISSRPEPDLYCLDSAVIRAKLLPAIPAEAYGKIHKLFDLYNINIKLLE